MMERWYVYHLVDPRDGAVFYVGKGQGRRVLDHEYQARQGVTSDKCSRIRDIWAAQQEVRRCIVKRFGSESAAYEFERAEIHRLMATGLANGKRTFPYSDRSVNFIVWAARISEGFEREFTVEITENNDKPTTRWAAGMWRECSERGLVKLARIAVEEAVSRCGFKAVNNVFRRHGITFHA